MLIYYNFLDYVPFVQAIQDLHQPYLQQGLNIFKISFSVTGMAKLQMIKDSKKCFLLFVFQTQWRFVQNSSFLTDSWIKFDFLSPYRLWRNKNPLPRNKKFRKS